MGQTSKQEPSRSPSTGSPSEEGGLYLDHAASTPPWPSALDTFVRLAKADYANPSSRHRMGANTKEIYERTKELFCESLGFHDGLFTHCSSATEANNQIISSYLKSFPEGKIYIASDAHASMTWVYEQLPEQCSWIPLDPNGEYLLPKPEGKALFLLNLVSQDMGTLHVTEPWFRLSDNPEIHLHIDAVQAVGKVPLNFDELPFHSLSFSSHKFGGIKGSAGLLSRNSTVAPLLKGGPQEQLLRAGTENLPALAGSLEALQLNLKLYEEKSKHLIDLRDQLIECLKDLPLIFNEPSLGVPWIFNFSAPGYLGSELVASLSRYGFNTSTSSACHQNSPSPPRAISALGRNDSEALGSLRLSLHPNLNWEMLSTFPDALKRCLDELN